ncbi:MAG: STT3 domain-containing protein [Candidatus Omnitrophota bacterium]
MTPIHTSLRKWSTASILYFLACALLVTTIGIFFRLMPLFKNNTSSLRHLATTVVHDHLKTGIALSIERAFPGLTSAQKTRMADAEYHTALAKDATALNREIENGVAQMRAKTTGGASAYLLEADSYHFYGLTERLVQTGSIGSAVKRGKYFDPLMLAPGGKWEPLSLHPYLGFYLYRFVSFFKKDAPLMPVAKFLVIIIAALCAPVFLLFCRRAGISLLASTVGSLFFMLSPFFAQRTSFGWYDTDVYNFLFPTIILLLLFEGISRVENIRKSIIFALAASLATGVYELFWHGWAFMVIGTAASLPAVILFDRFFTRSATTKRILAFYAVYIGATCAGVMLLTSPATFFYTFEEGYKMMNSFLSAKFDLWPNIFLTVGETQPIAFDKLSFLLGGTKYFTALAALGLLLAATRSLRSKDLRALTKLCVIAGFVAILLYLSLKSVRFAVQLTVPLAFAFTLFLDEVYRLASSVRLGRFIPAFKKSSTTLGWAAALCIVAGSLCPLQAGYQICTHINGVYNQTWENVLRDIRERTPPESIINTWWCPGHFITSVAKRRVTIDGASQHEPQTYWIATVLLAQDEDTALGILRMLNLSGNRMLVYLENNCRVVTSEAIALIKELAPLTREQGRRLLLARRFTADEVDDLLPLMYGTPPPSYFMVYNELADGYMTLPYIGNWDFKKAEYLALNSFISQKDEKARALIPARDSAGYMDFILGMSGGIPPCSPEYPETSRDGMTIRFQNNLIVELDTKECFLLSGDGTKFIRPKSLFYIEDSVLKEKEFPGGTLPYAVLLIKKEDTYRCLLLDRSLARSMLFKLYYLNGKGLAHFSPFIRREDPSTKISILVFKITW